MPTMNAELPLTQGSHRPVKHFPVFLNCSIFPCLHFYFLFYKGLWILSLQNISMKAVTQFPGRKSCHSRRKKRSSDSINISNNFLATTNLLIPLSLIEYNNPVLNGDKYKSFTLP